MNLEEEVKLLEEKAEKGRKRARKTLSPKAHHAGGKKRLADFHSGSSQRLATAWKEEDAND